MSIRSTLCTAAVAICALASPTIAQDVEITLTNVRPDAGKLYIALQNEEQFMKEDGVAGEIIGNPQDATVTIRLTDIPEGQYSFSVWHDLDGDGAFSMGPMGPTDGWTMPGAAALRGLPVFADNSFTVSGPKTTISEAMLYPQDNAR